VSRPVVLDRRSTPHGELLLRRVDDAFELIANGVFLMDSRDGRSERELVRLALPEGRPADVLIGGLGFGFSAAEALSRPEVRAVTVVEIEESIVHWARTVLRPVTGLDLDDPRIEVVVDDLAAYVAGMADQVDAICVDVDNGPDWLVHEANAHLYTREGLAQLRSRLRPGGRLTVWTHASAAGLLSDLEARFRDAHAVEIPRRDLPPDVVYVASASRRRSRRRLRP
jgi:spermidine synthase